MCAIDLQDARGGAVSGCTVSGSPVGVRAGDATGAGCASGISVTDCTVTQCTTGIEALSGGHHLVVRNHVSSCTNAFSVGAGNLVGPVLSTSADLATIPNPHANYAQ